MDHQQENRPLPLIILIIGLSLVLGCTIWSGAMFFLYNGSIIYGVIGGVCLGATYSFGKQLWAQLAAKKNSR